VIPQGKDALGAMRRRVSTRSYQDRPVDAAILHSLLSAAEGADHVSNAPPRVSLISGTELTSRVLTFVVGSYGLVLNAPHLLAGILPSESPAARVDLGYVLEQVVLQATEFGLGTCWITGTYDSNAAGDAVETSSSEVVAAVCALGRPSETRLGRFHSALVHRLAGAGRRKPLSEIAYLETWGGAWSAEGADPSLVTVLEHCRLAPSAANRQPWRFIVRRDAIALALKRSRPIDAGIVMAHFALAAASLGISGRWELRWSDPSLAVECRLPRTAVLAAVFA
jgi:nitroreductase